MKNIYKINDSIYITSDEEVKERDWFIQVNTKKRIKHHSKNGLLLQPQKFDKKIILTTDPDLIKDGVSKLPQQETLEEAAENLFNDFESKNPIVPQKHILPYKLGFIEGAKWKEERMYSEEEVREALKYGVDNSEIIKRGCKDIEGFIQSLKQPKKN